VLLLIDVNIPPYFKELLHMIPLPRYFVHLALIVLPYSGCCSMFDFSNAALMLNTREGKSVGFAAFRGNLPQNITHYTEICIVDQVISLFKDFFYICTRISEYVPQTM
jgi:hypothetical protein